MGHITLERLLREVDKLKRKTDTGGHDANPSDAGLARAIRQLCARGLDPDRARATAALADALQHGVIAAPAETRLRSRLGLVA